MFQKEIPTMFDLDLKISGWEPFPVTAQRCLYLAGVKVDFKVS